MFKNYYQLNSSDSSDDDNFLLSLATNIPKLRQYPQRPDVLFKYTDYEFRERFRFSKETVVKLSEMLGFYCLPKCKNMKKEWLSILGVNEQQIPNSRWIVCSTHFAETCFLPRKDGNKRRILKDTAVPTIVYNEKSNDAIDLCEDDTGSTTESCFSEENHVLQEPKATNRKHDSGKIVNKYEAENELNNKNSIFMSFGSTLALQLKELYKLDAAEAFTCMQAIQNHVLNKIAELLKKKSPKTSLCSIDTSSQKKSTFQKKFETSSCVGFNSPIKPIHKKKTLIFTRIGKATKKRLLQGKLGTSSRIGTDSQQKSTLQKKAETSSCAQTKSIFHYLNLMKNT